MGGPPAARNMSSTSRWWEDRGRLPTSRGLPLGDVTGSSWVALTPIEMDGIRGHGANPMQSPASRDDRLNAMRAMKSALRRSYLRGAAALALSSAIIALESELKRERAG